MEVSKVEKRVLKVEMMIKNLMRKKLLYFFYYILIVVDLFQIFFKQSKKHNLHYNKNSVNPVFFGLHGAI